MKRFGKDKLRGQKGTVRFEYIYVAEDTGLTIHGTTRSLRMTRRQFEMFQSFLTDLYDSSGLDTPGED